MSRRKHSKETIIRVKENSIETATRNLEPTDIVGLQAVEWRVKEAVQESAKNCIFPIKLRIK